jgi:predicted adenine nucleotide alpha hydrolase (AANH) superfamily ATPase
MAEGKDRLLLHVCCGPCSTEVIERLAAGHDLVLYFFNPNIFPMEEYERRLAEAERYAGSHGHRFISGEWDHAGWLEAVKGLEAEPEGARRCASCFAYRLEAAARRARQEAVASFTTTLTISPHKSAPAVNAAGEAAGRKAGVAFLAADFKKKDGFLKSCQKAREAGMYRQDYCGCEFSNLARRTDSRTNAPPKEVRSSL